MTPGRAGEASRVLLVGADEVDYLIIRDLLAAQDQAAFELDWCADFDSGLRVIGEQRHDVYLIDHRIGQRTGPELVQEGFAARPAAPVIILTGEGGDQAAAEAAGGTATEYLAKRGLGPIGLERSIRYAVSQHQAIRELARSEERYALAVSAASDGLWDWDLICDRIYLSPRWHAIIGQPEGPGEESPSAWFDLVHHSDVAALRAAIDAHLRGRAPNLLNEHRMRHVDGTWRWVLARGLAIRDADGAASRMAGSMSDITDRRTAERRRRHDALHDSLTGLPNRALFVDRVDQVLARATRYLTLGCVVLFLDIDRFELVNDSLGRAVGDRLLVAVARRLARVLRPGDTVSRIGGDVFTILLDGLVAEDGAAIVAERLQRSLGDAFTVDGHELFVTASIGIALSAPEMTAAELLRNADIAMYDAKRRGRARCVVFDESMHRRIVDRLACQNDVRHAVEQRLLPVHFQPIVYLDTGGVRGLEALARWPTGPTAIAPLDFIPIAEETGLIGALGLHVLQTALAALAGWRRAGVVDHGVCVSVNVSGRQLDDPQLPAKVQAALAAAGLPASALRLEITESVLMREPERMAAILSEICATGVGLHLDDFGTGYASLTALHHFPFDALKIDRSFVASMNGGPGGSDVIVRSTVALAHSLGLRVIAEGIEREDQLRRLQDLGVECGQGFLFSPPLDVPGTQELLAGWSPAPAPAIR